MSLGNSARYCQGADMGFPEDTQSLWHFKRAGDNASMDNTMRQPQ